MVHNFRLMLKSGKFFSLFTLIVPLTLLYPEVGLCGWTVQEIDADVGYSYYSQIEIDDAGNPHVLYLDANDLLQYQYWDGDKWNQKQVSSAHDGALTLDSLGQPHICYHETGKKLGYLRKNNGVWYDQTMDSEIGGTGTARYCDIALDSFDNQHFSYIYDDPISSLKHLYWSCGSLVVCDWVDETALDYPSLSDGRTNLAVDAVGMPHISFFDSDNDVVYVYKTTSLFSPWVVEVAGNGGDECGHETPIVIGSDHSISIAYSDTANGWGKTPGTLPKIIHTSRFGNLGWMDDIVQEDMYGFSCEVGGALNINNEPGVIFLSGSNNNLMYYHRNNTTYVWEKDIVDSNVKRVGGIAYGPQGNPQFVYIKKDKKLYFAKKSFPWHMYMPLFFNSSQ